MSKSSPWSQGRKTPSGREKRTSYSSTKTTMSTTDDARYIYCCKNAHSYTSKYYHIISLFMSILGGFVPNFG